MKIKENFYSCFNILPIPHSYLLFISLFLSKDTVSEICFSFRSQFLVCINLLACLLHKISELTTLFNCPYGSSQIHESSSPTSNSLSLLNGTECRETLIKIQSQRWGSIIPILNYGTDKRRNPVKQLPTLYRSIPE